MKVVREKIDTVDTILKYGECPRDIHVLNFTRLAPESVHKITTTEQSNFWDSLFSQKSDGVTKELVPARKTRSLTHIAVVDGFQRNKHIRGFRIGIDASLWFFHAQSQQVREGENPELRMFLFRCLRLLGTPFLPLFVFDGPGRPKWKRGHKVGKGEDWMTHGARRIIGALGFEWRTAPGEAEAELASLNRLGIIDAVMTDDVDTFLFGATMVIRNPGLALSGNLSKHDALKNRKGRNDGNHAFTYTSEDLASHESVKLTTGGLILIGLLNGGDYHLAGLPGCGVKIAGGLARAGFGDSLLNAAQALPKEDLGDFLTQWRAQMVQELKTNASGFLPSKRAKLAADMPDTFPSIDVLLSYVKPLTSETAGLDIPQFKWDREPDIGQVASVCEQYFEWGVLEVIVLRLRKNMWNGVICRALRRGAMEADERERRLAVTTNGLATPRKNRQQPAVPGTPSSVIRRHFSRLAIAPPTKRREEDPEDPPIIVKIHSERAHESTDDVSEYRLEYDPRAMVLAAEATVRGDRPPLTTGFFAKVMAEEGVGVTSTPGEEVDGEASPQKFMVPVDKNSNDRVWMPACMVESCEPGLVEEYLDRKANKGKKKVAEPRAKAAGKKKTAKQKDREVSDVSEEEDVVRKPRPKAARKKAVEPESLYPKGQIAPDVWEEEDMAPPKPRKPRKKTTQAAGSNEEDVFGTIQASGSGTGTRKSLLELLDASAPAILSRSTSASETKRIASSSKPRKTSTSKSAKSLRRPDTLPREQEEETPPRDKRDVFATNTTTTTSILGAKSSHITVTGSPRKAHELSSDSDTTAHLNKSPRKLKSHQSPRARSRLDESDSEDEELDLRSRPFRKPVAKTSTKIQQVARPKAGSRSIALSTVVDISSDDEVTVLPIAMRVPLPRTPTKCKNNAGYVIDLTLT